MPIDGPDTIRDGGAQVFRLPTDSRCAYQARAHLTETMRALDFDPDVIRDAKLAVSELATNSHIHAEGTTEPPELWIWARTCPSPELVVSVFDTRWETLPSACSSDTLDEHGKGLSIVAALSVDTGTDITRSRLTRARGKRVWFTIALPLPWPTETRVISPSQAARGLYEALTQRGVPATRQGDLVTAAPLNIWVEPKTFTWHTGGTDTHQPLQDLQETAEQITTHLESVT
ncbi:ATP-binding protein [Actinomadura pelletieri]|nr:ATP-binding protein [Actinomadura pelletieri]